jgi:Na+/proline symporter
MNENGIATDAVFPSLALNHLGILAGLAFIVGLTAATFSSADSVLTTLTTAFCIDFLNFEQRTDLSEKKKMAIRMGVHIGFSVLLIVVILGFRLLNSKAVIDTILMLANYTYGPLLGLFAFGLFTKLPIRDAGVPIVCLASPVLCYYLDMFAPAWFGGYKFGYELLVVNGLITFCGLLLLVKRREIPIEENFRQQQF